MQTKAKKRFVTTWYRMLLMNFVPSSTYPKKETDCILPHP